MKSTDLLQAAIAVQSERGAEYKKPTDGDKQVERSFARVAAAFNEITGRDIKASEIALMLTVLKLVRQCSQDRVHADSLVDAVSYSSLWAELVYVENEGK